LKLTLSLVVWILWAIDLGLFGFLLIHNILVGYDPINYGLYDMIDLTAITLMVVAGLGFFYIHYFKTKQKPS
jgi:hypothetical protein